MFASDTVRKFSVRRVTRRRGMDSGRAKAAARAEVHVLRADVAIGRVVHVRGGWDTWAVLGGAGGREFGPQREYVSL